MSTPPISRLRASAAALLLLGPVAANAGPAPVFPGPAGTQQPVQPKHLPAGHDELVFHGETAQRSWSVYLGRGEIERAKAFQLALKNAVALLPERSSVKLSVNGRLLATLPSRSANGVSVVPVAIPPGLLVPGFNRVGVSVTMAHRVDCSVPATYELWTLLDPAQTGFVVQPSTLALGGIRSIEDIAGEPLAEDGTTRIRLRAADSGDAVAIGRAGRFIDAMVNRAGLTRPVVDVAPDAGRGPGIDIVIATAHASDDLTKAMRILGREDGIIFARDAETDRLTLVLSGVDEADLDRQITAFAAKTSHLSPPTAAGEMAVEGESRRSFAELGLSTDNFSGRHYTSALDVVLPSDFYPANYDKARLLIDGSYVANLDPDSGLVFRVNGALVSSLRLGPDRGGVLQHEIVELPLRFFHPGHNEIGIEGTTSTPADRQCDTANMSRDVRFTLSGTSEIEFPRFAHLGTIPQIQGAMAGPQGGEARGRVDLYLADGDATSVGSGLTVLANMTVVSRDVPVPVIHLGAPSSDGTPGIVVAPYDALPAALSAPMRAKMTLPDQDGPAGSTVDDGLNGSAAADGSGGRLATAPDGATAPPQGFDVPRLVAGVERALKDQGFFFGSDQSARTVPFTPHSLMVAAVDPRPTDQKLAGMDLPRFTSDTAQWLVVTAADAGTLRDGLTRLVSNGQWTTLGGQAVSLDLQKGNVTSVQPSRVVYVAPSRLVLSDLRPILGGIVSNHIELSLVILMLLMAILGVSTHTLIRRMGAK